MTTSFPGSGRDMQILRPLTQTNIALVWSGVVISAIGDEFYNVAILWVAVTYLGTKAGLLVAFQCGIVLAAGLLAGAWAERAMTAPSKYDRVRAARSV